MPSSLRCLFIGNSFTARNDVPGLIGEMARARGHTFEHKLISAGGASLRMHWNKGAAPKAIEAGGWDYVILQEQSTLPVKNRERTHENIRLFDEAIRAAGAKMVLYLTWAREKVPETQQALTECYMSIGEELGAIVVPAGIAWERVLAKKGHPVLHDKDGSHPTLAGSYLAACVFFAVLFDESPVGLPADLKGLTPDEVKLLQTTAWETVQVPA
jgi:hypothetical protein